MLFEMRSIDVEVIKKSSILNKHIKLVKKKTKKKNEEDIIVTQVSCANVHCRLRELPSLFLAFLNKYKLKL